MHDDSGSDTPDDLGGFAPPPFDPAGAMVTLRRVMKELKLVEREGLIEWKGLVVAAAAIEGRELAVKLARKPLRSPDWEKKSLKNHADLRRWTDDLRKRLVSWADVRSDDT
jgi:hypothetical protein